jgi:hypothetical protein
MLEAYSPLSRGDVDEHHDHRNQNCYAYNTVEREFSRAEIRRISTVEGI